MRQCVLGDYSVRTRGATLSNEGRGVESKIYWFVIKNPNKMYKVRALNNDCLPSGVVKELDIDEFMRHFDPEPEHYVEKTIPAIKFNLQSAENQEERKALVAKLGIEIGEEDEDYLEKIMQRVFIDSRFVCFEQCKEINEFIIRLRKRKNLDEAVQYCQRALELNQFDENLLFNVARVYYERKEYGKAREFVDRALQVNPGMEAAVRFKKHLAKKTGTGGKAIRL